MNAKELEEYLKTAPDAELEINIADGPSPHKSRYALSVVEKERRARVAQERLAVDNYDVTAMSDDALLVFMAGWKPGTKNYLRADAEIQRRRAAHARWHKSPGKSGGWVDRLKIWAPILAAIFGILAALKKLLE